MHDFTIHLRFDTPVLLGGVKRLDDPTKRLDAGAILRGPAVRGLLHTFTRALFGPLLGSDVKLTREQERRLLGSPGGANEQMGATFRLEPSFSRIASESVHITPHDHAKGSRDAYSPAEFAGTVSTSLTVRPRAEACARISELPAMLWIVCWIAFAFGSLGLRARRGYGSVTVVGADRVPDLGRLLAQPGSLPLLGAVADRAGLLANLETGLRLVREAARGWLGAPATATGAAADATNFFQILDQGHVYVGSATKDWENNWENTLASLMQAAHETKDAHADYGAQLGHASRLASPLWVRYFRTGEGLVPVATFSPATAARSAVDQFLDQGVHAKDAAGNWVTLV